MTEIDRILDLLKRAFEGHAWHGPSVREVLAGVTAEQAHARPVPNGHTIWELVRHIAVWEDVGRRRLKGDRAQIKISSTEDWPPPEDTSEAAWESALAARDRHLQLPPRHRLSGHLHKLFLDVRPQSTQSLHAEQRFNGVGELVHEA